MAIYSWAGRTTGFTSANACAGIYTAATTRPKLLEFSYITATGTAQTIGLGRPATIGTQTGPVLFQAEDPGDAASVTNAHLTWSVQPGAPTVFMRRWNGAATVGVGIVWTFPRGLIIPVSSALVVWNITTTVAADVNFIIDE